MRSDVQTHIQRAILRWSVSEEQQHQMLQVLFRDGFPLSRDARIRVGALAATAYDIAGGRSETERLEAAAIAELYIAASFLLDDVMDDEVGPGTTIAKETALGTTLLLMAEATLDELAEHLAVDRFALKLEAHRLLITACDGQLQEISTPDDYEGLLSWDVDQALTLTQRKAGTLGELTALVGAGAAAGRNSEITSALRRVYSNLFTYRQVIDDLSDATSDGRGDESDITKFKPTVPSVFYHRTVSGLGASPEESAIGTQPIIDKKSARSFPNEEDLRKTGTSLFTQLTAEVVRNRAIKDAELIQERYGGADQLLAVLGRASSDHLETEKPSSRAPSGAQAS